MFDYDLVHELESTSKWRYWRIQYWLARIDWYRAERSVRTQPSIPWRDNPIFKEE